VKIAPANLRAPGVPGKNAQRRRICRCVEAEDTARGGRGPERCGEYLLDTPLDSSLVRFRFLLLLVPAVLAISACGGDDGGTLRIYTSVTQGTVDAVVAGFEESHPAVQVEVFRAPTGELTARIAAEQREGGLTADVLWLTDPLSMGRYAADGMLLAWDPDGLDAVPAEFRTETFWGTRVLTMVAIHGLDVPAPISWADLTGDAYADGVAIPDPGFAGSALGALGWFAL